MARIALFAGPFGSGKTEIATNYALRLARQRAAQAGDRVALIDLDIVTPYYRARDLTDRLAADGVEVVAPHTYGRYSEPVALAPAILGTIQNERRTVVVDVGGDDVGANVLARYGSDISLTDHELFLVVNPYRPAAATDEGVRRVVAEIERASDLKIAALVSNPHMMDETTIETIQMGHQAVVRAAGLLALPVQWVCAEESIAATLPDELQGSTVLRLRRYFLPVWDRYSDLGQRRPNVVAGHEAGSPGRETWDTSSSMRSGVRDVRSVPPPAPNT
jgi:hypothetical protein